VNLLVVGGGSIGERHLRCFQQIGCEVALCDSNEARRAEMVSRYGLTQSFASVREAASKDWDAAIICTPAHLHVEHALQLAASTPALLIEKPLCTSLADAERLRDGLAGKVVQVAYVLRAHPATRQVREQLQAGEIGTLHQVTVVAGQHFPTFRPAYRDIYYARRENGGGAIQDAATHLFELIQHLAGPLQWIFCDAAHQVLPGVEVEDTVHLLAGLAASGLAGPQPVHGAERNPRAA
jgi:predicted dehydrogenase